jgi:hypothetical protein
MSNRLDDLDFTKLGEKFDQKDIKNNPLLSDDHDDNWWDGHTDVVKEPQLPPRSGINNMNLRPSRRLISS